MMLGYVNVMLAIAEAERAYAQHEEFLIMKLPPEDQPAARKKLEERREKRRQEAIEERRHQELCAAIRSTKFW